MDAAAQSFFAFVMRPARGVLSSEGLAAARRLHDLLMEPMLPALAGRRKLFLSVDGILNFVPFAALHDGKDFLVSRYQFGYLTSGRDLLRRDDLKPSNDSVVVLADPQYSTSFQSAPRGGTRGQGEVGEPASETAAEISDDVVAREEDKRGQAQWQRLPGTAEEATAIRRILPHARILLGDAATKSALLHLSAPGVLHIATHGIFDADLDRPAESRGLVSVDSGAGKITTSTLLRSALVMATEAR